MRVVLAPMNFASMPVTIVQELKRRGYDAKHVQYMAGDAHKFGFSLDHIANYKEHGGRIPTQFMVLDQLIQENWDIFHFWNKSLLFRGNGEDFTGLDLPLLKARGRRIAHRFTGFDLRLPSWDMAVNEHSPFHHGYVTPWDEPLQKAYMGFLREYVDQFVVQDPELQQHFPEARVIPRALDLEKWDFVGISSAKRRPLVVHAPTNDVYKGSKFVIEAVEALQAEGVPFEFKMIKDVSLDQARKFYQAADIIVDQLLIGSTGVLTLEAWALGKPCVVYLQEGLFEDFYKTDDVPVVNANPHNIKEQLRMIIGDVGRREELSYKGRELAENFHDIRTVVDQFVNMYQGMMDRPLHYPTGSGDLEYLKWHFMKAGKDQANARNFQRIFAEERVAFRRYRQRAERGLPPLPPPRELTSVEVIYRTVRRLVRRVLKKIIPRSK